MCDSLAYFETALQHCCDQGASDLHLSAGCFPIYRISGELQPDTQASLLTSVSLAELVSALLDTDEQAAFHKNRSYDLGYTAQNRERFRINIYRERGDIAFAIRHLDNTFKTLEELKLPTQLHRLSRLKDGLVLVTGATGSGKTTTLATLINEINNTRKCHILTIEDPIEFVHHNNEALVHQRELGKDFNRFSDAISSALREDPDVILLGEMRDVETMRAALMAAETGHLVFSTLHTNDAVGVIDRLVGAFPGDEQSGVRQQLSMVLRSVVTQTLVKSLKGGRVAVNEVLIVGSAIANLIRSHKPQQIRSAMETGRAEGNQTFDLALAQRVAEGFIERQEAERLSHRPASFNELLKLAQQKAR